MSGGCSGLHRHLTAKTLWVPFPPEALLCASLHAVPAAVWVLSR